jgi:hypothetical protein
MALDGFGADFFDEGPQLGSASMNELGAELDGPTTFDFLRHDSSTDAWFCFENADAYATLSQSACGDKAGHAGTEDEHIDIVLQGEFRLSLLFSDAAGAVV